MSSERSDAIVLFGASGDLAKKMTFVSLYRLAERDLLDMPTAGRRLLQSATPAAQSVATARP